MNNTLIWIVVLVLFLVTGMVAGYKKKSAMLALIYLPGILSIAAGIYLLPATMWKNISFGLLIVGLALELIAIISTVRLKKI